jgi:DNA adenine methylase
MSAPPLVPPIKCQGIKTKLVSEIRALAAQQDYERWVEPFCGSCVVPFNLQPQRALLCDSNVHIIRLYQDIQAGHLTAPMAKAFLTEEGEKLRTRGEDYFYEVRERFNTSPSSLGSTASCGSIVPASSTCRSVGSLTALLCNTFPRSRTSFAGSGR